MAATPENHRVPDKRLAAVCGLFCPACTVFIGNREDPERLTRLAERLRHPVEELECNGCRSEKRSYYCRDHCVMIRCAAERESISAANARNTHVPI